MISESEASNFATPILSICSIPVHKKRKFIQIPITLQRANGEQFETTALIDSGAGGVFIDRKFAEENGLLVEQLDKSIPVYNVDGTRNISGEIEKKVVSTTEIFGNQRVEDFMITALGKQKVILGIPWLEKENPDIDWRERTLRWRTPLRKAILPRIQQIELETTDDLVRSFVIGVITDKAHETWVQSKMSKSQLFAVKNEQKNDGIPVEQLLYYYDLMFRGYDG